MGTCTSLFEEDIHDEWLMHHAARMQKNQQMQWATPSKKYVASLQPDSPTKKSMPSFWKGLFNKKSNQVTPIKHMPSIDTLQVEHSRAMVRSDVLLKTIPRAKSLNEVLDDRQRAHEALYAHEPKPDPPGPKRAKSLSVLMKKKKKVEAPSDAHLKREFALQRHFSYSVDAEYSESKSHHYLAYYDPHVVIVDRPERSLMDYDEDDGFRYIPDHV